MSSNTGIATSDGRVWEEHRNFANKMIRTLGIGKRLGESIVLDQVESFTNHLRAQCEIQKDGRYNGLEENLSLCAFNILWNFMSGSTFSYTDAHIKEILKGTRLQMKAAEQTGPWNFSIGAQSVLIYILKFS